MRPRNFPHKVNRRRERAYMRLVNSGAPTEKRLLEMTALRERILTDESARAIRTKKHGGKERRIQNWRLGITKRVATEQAA
jgi:hypothetical protein